MNSVVLLAALGAATPAADPPLRPSGPPPLLVTAKHDGKEDTLTILDHQMVYRQEMRVRKERTADGKFVEVAYTVTVPELVPVTRRALVKDMKVFGLDGLPIGASKLAKLLEKQQMVLWSQDGRPPDSFYTQFFKEDMLILVPPAPKAEPIAPPRPSPVPGQERRP